MNEKDLLGMLAMVLEKGHEVYHSNREDKEQLIQIMDRLAWACIATIHDVNGKGGKQ